MSVEPGSSFSVPYFPSTATFERNYPNTLITWLPINPLVLIFIQFYYPFITHFLLVLVDYIPTWTHIPPYLQVERARGITAAGSFMMDTLNFGWTYSYYIRTIILYLYYGKCRKIKDIIIFRGTADPFFSYDTSQLYSHQMIPVGLISKSHLAIPPWSPKPLVGNPSIGGTVRCWLNFDDEDHF